MRALFLNNYDMKSAYKEWKDGVYPGHHLWGVTEFEKYHIEFTMLEYEKFPTINKYWRLQKLLKLNQLEMTALEQQLRAVIVNKFDVIYSACQVNTFLLGRFKSMNLYKKPIIITAHHPVHYSKNKERELKGYEKIICLSSLVRDELLSNFSLNPENLVKIDWGADLLFYERFISKEAKSIDVKPIIVSAGKANRDYDTLVKAANGANCTVRIYCSLNSAPKNRDIPKNIDIVIGERNKNAISYPDLMKVYNDASAIVIPLVDIDALAGLTSLIDAMALGKPVIMSKNKYIDIDIEKENIGFWVEAGNVKEMKVALDNIVSNPKKASEMGMRARKLCESKYNIQRYGMQVAELINSI